MTDLECAKNYLRAGEYTCVLCKGEEVHTSMLRGVSPLVQWLKSQKDFSAFSAADKVVGKATAFLYVLLGVKSVYASVISIPALQILQENGIDAWYNKKTEHIINRKGDGICPFEKAVLNISDPYTAYEVICCKMKEMNIE